MSKERFSAVVQDVTYGETRELFASYNSDDGMVYITEATSDYLVSMSPKAAAHLAIMLLESARTAAADVRADINIAYCAMNGQ